MFMQHMLQIYFNLIFLMQNNMPSRARHKKRQQRLAFQIGAASCA